MPFHNDKDYMSENHYWIEKLKEYAIPGTGLPILDQQTFERFTNELGKEEFRNILADYIFKFRPRFPLKKQDKEIIWMKTIIG